MKITIKPNRDGFNANYRKESSFYESLSVIVPSKKGERFARTSIEARFYGPASVVYCCVWAKPKDGSEWLMGSGKAGGYGYHKASAALESALGAAGITLGERISGRGSSAMESALESVSRKLGYATGRLYRTHA